MPDSSRTPISGEPHDPYEKYRVEEIQKDKEASQFPGKEPASLPKPSPAFSATITLLFKKLLDLFERTTPRGLSHSAEGEMRSHLLRFQELIEKQKESDISQDSFLLNRFSLIWHQLLDDALRFRRETPLSIQIRELFQEIQHYPAHHDHSLGYYLTEYAGQRWLPFPYMEMIQELHEDHMIHNEGSHLSKWSRQIGEIVQTLCG